MAASGTATSAYQWRRNGLNLAGATGPTYTYQWRRDGVDIIGATGALYSTEPTVATDAGRVYSVVVGNAAGSVTSPGATLQVTTEWTGIREDAPLGLPQTTGRAVATDAAGNVFIAGSMISQSGGNRFSFDNPGTRSDAWVAKYSAAGALLWGHTSLAAGGLVDNDWGYAIGVDSAGNVFVGGEAGDQLPKQPPASALRGPARWRGRLCRKVRHCREPALVQPGAGAGPGRANGVAVSGDGAAVYLTGRTYSDFDWRQGGPAG